MKNEERRMKKERWRAGGIEIVNKWLLSSVNGRALFHIS